MALSREQFQQLRNKGLNVDQIVRFERGETPPIQQVPPEEKEGFIRGELRGGADISGLTGAKRFGAELFQTTIGSKGLLGVAQLPAKVIGTKLAIDEPGIPERFTTTPKQALGTALSAAATISPVGIFRGASLARKALTIGREAARGAGFATGIPLAEDRLPTGKELAVGAGIGAAVPGVGGALGAVVRKTFSITGNVFKRLAGGLGVSFDDIARNPEVAQQTAQTLLKGEQTVSNILEQNTKVVTTGIRTFRQRLRKDFGKALESLSETQIDTQAVKTAAIGALGQNGIKVTKTGFNMEAAEFTGKAMQRRATGIIEEINNLQRLDGKALQRIISKIESLKFKSPGADPERLAFNALMKDLSKSLGDAVAKATPELQVANKAFSRGMQLTEVMENEFGKVKFSNLPELVKASKKMEGLLRQKGIAPEVVDDFLTTIGQEPTALRAAEAVRAPFAAEPVAEAAGMTPFEFIRQITAGIVSPEDATRLSIFIARASNLSEKTVSPIIKVLVRLKPVERITIIKSLIQAFEG